MTAPTTTRVAAPTTRVAAPTTRVAAPTTRVAAAYQAAEAQAFAAHHAGARTEQVGELTLVCLGVTLEAAQTAFHARAMDAAASLAQDGSARAA